MSNDRLTLKARDGDSTLPPGSTERKASKSSTDPRS